MTSPPRELSGSGGGGEVIPITPGGGFHLSSPRRSGDRCLRELNENQMWWQLLNFLRAGDWVRAQGRGQSELWEGPESRPAPAPAGIQVRGPLSAASGLAGRAGRGLLRGSPGPSKHAGGPGGRAASAAAAAVAATVAAAAVAGRGAAPKRALPLRAVARGPAPAGRRRRKLSRREADAFLALLRCPVQRPLRKFSFFMVRDSRFLAASEQGSLVVWISPDPCLPRGGNGPHRLLSPSALGVGPGFLPLPNALLSPATRGR